VRRGTGAVPRRDGDGPIRDINVCGVWNEVVIVREIQVKGYEGSITVLKDYLRPKRALRVRPVTVRMRLLPFVI
jgi:hypothetical protein